MLSHSIGRFSLCVSRRLSQIHTQTHEKNHVFTLPNWIWQQHYFIDANCKLQMDVVQNSQQICLVGDAWWCVSDQCPHSHVNIKYVCSIHLIQFLNQSHWALSSKSKCGSKSIYYCTIAKKKKYWTNPHIVRESIPNWTKCQRHFKNVSCIFLSIQSMTNIRSVSYSFWFFSSV